MDFPHIFIIVMLFLQTMLEWRQAADVLFWIIKLTLEVNVTYVIGQIPGVIL